jgi:glycosyltransferase involved in cell wall biosynthesis
MLKRERKVDISAYLRLRDAFATADIIHAHKHSSLFHSHLWSVRRNRPKVVAHLHSNIYSLGLREQLVARCLCGLSNKVIVVSLADYVDCLKKWKIDPQRLEVVHNGVDTTLFSGNYRETARKLLQVTPDTYVVGTVGSINKYKGHEFLVKCAAEVKRHIKKKIHFVIVGNAPDDDLMTRLTLLSEQLDLTSSISFLGYRRDTHIVMAGFDLFVMPSRTECLPVALLEAMSSGIPSIATSVGGIPEILDDGKYGLLVPPEDSHLLANAVLSIINSPERQASLSSLGRQRIIQHFSVEAMAHKTEAIYNQLLE